jgi:hypothetical protein
MESNADKQLREKLKGMEYPFDPQAWEHMEAMLDEKKKRRGFFWWWFGGIAAALLITAGTVGYGLWLMGEDDRIARAEYAQQQEVSETDKKVSDEQLATSSNEEQTTESKEQVANGKEQNGNNSKGQVANESEEETANGKEQKRNSKQQTVISKTKAVNSDRQLAGSEQPTTNSKPSAIITHHSSSATKKDKKKAQLLSREETNTSGNVASNSSTSSAATGVTTPQQQEEAFSLNTMYALLLGKEEEFQATKDEDNTLPKRKKPVFRYSLGVVGALSATTPGWKNYNHQYELPQAGKPSFYSTPSYMVGITNDFLFANRFAFTAGFMYAQTSFKVYAPYAQGYSQVPYNYTSHIKGLAIPMGIKVYPVVTGAFKLYVSAGFIHHIKLQETFSYTMPDTVSNAIVNIPPSSKDVFFPTQTSFGSEGYEAIQADQMGNLSTVTVNTKPFSVNEAKRYYTSFYAGLGVEGIIRNHWILFAEPTYYMTLQRIGYQERRMFDFGGSAGFRYQF